MWKERLSAAAGTRQRGTYAGQRISCAVDIRTLGKRKNTAIGARKRTTANSNISLTWSANSVGGRGSETARHHGRAPLARTTAQLGVH